VSRLPRDVEWLGRLLLPAEAAEVILGDLQEEALERFGADRPGARAVWLRAELLRSVAAILADRARRGTGSARGGGTGGTGGGLSTGSTIFDGDGVYIAASENDVGIEGPFFVMEDSVKDGSPALELGFENFPMDQFGVVKPELRMIAKTPPLPGTLEAAAVRSGGWDRQYSAPKTATWLRATLKNIENNDEMSAVGLGDRNGVLVTVVPEDSPAARAGLKENDVIRTVGGQMVLDLAALAGLRKSRRLGKPLTLTLWRDQAEVTLIIVR